MAALTERPHQPLHPLNLFIQRPRRALHQRPRHIPIQIRILPLQRQRRGAHGRFHRAQPRDGGPSRACSCLRMVISAA